MGVALAGGLLAAGAMMDSHSSRSPSNTGFHPDEPAGVVPVGVGRYSGHPSSPALGLVGGIGARHCKQAQLVGYGTDTCHRMHAAVAAAAGAGGSSESVPVPHADDLSEVNQLVWDSGADDCTQYPERQVGTAWCPPPPGPAPSSGPDTRDPPTVREPACFATCGGEQAPGPAVGAVRVDTLARQGSE